MEYKEIFVLKEMLEKEKIPFDFLKPNENWYQIYYPAYNNGRYVCSVTQSSFSYGGNTDLLEIMGLQGTGNYVEGWLSAQNVYERIKKYNERGTK